jgi:epoxide hydrolase-like predicted phosphatase
MNKEVKIKAVIFDVGSVLQLQRYHLFKNRGGKSGVHQYIAERLQLSLDTWFDSIDSAYAASMEGRIGEVQTVNTIAKNLGVISKNLKKLFVRAYKKYHKRNNLLYSIAKKLKKEGYVIGVLSDQWALSKKSLLPKKDRQIFDFAILSDEVGLRKPDIRIYKLLIKKLRSRKKTKLIKPSEILFIDNRDWNTIPAEKLGMKTILFKNNKQCVKELQKFGVL